MLMTFADPRGAAAATLMLCLSIGNVLASEAKVGFSPGGTAQALVLDTLKQARQQLDVAAYSFTSKVIAEAVRDAKQRGVVVRVIADAEENSGKYSVVTFLANQGVNVRISNRYASMHNKFIIADQQTVQTGSFNYSASANKRNAENVLVLKDVPALANTYSQEFNRLWAEAIPVKASY
jgi:phosphatidylserine/phosphatidylglycerophosphate/cardiolipin synthase-like enzyme